MTQADQNSTPESGTLPGRYEFIREPDGPMSVPEDPEWNRFSDTIRTFSADPGATYERQDNLGTADATDHNRGTEEPSFEIAYDLQQFPVDENGDPKDASADGILRDEYNQLLNSHLAVGRTEVPGGNDGAGMRVYTVMRGGKIETVETTNDPTEENPILMELSYQPRKVRSYTIHQPAEPTTLIVASTSAEDDGLEVTIESEESQVTETLDIEFEGYGEGSYGDSLYGGDMETGVETVEEFGDIDGVWLSEEPVGDIYVNTPDGTTLMEIAGGLTYSEDDQPVDGDRGVPVLGEGSHADPIGEPYEHFVGDRVERPLGSPIRPRLNSLSWTIENSFETDSVHESRLPTVDEGDRTVSVDADVAGPKATHDSMMESLQKTQNPLGHELSTGVIRFNNAVVEDSGEREHEASDQAVASISETFAASGDPAVELFPDQTLDEVMS